MTTNASSANQVTLSGRELALQRRQAMALRGKSVATKSVNAKLAATSTLVKSAVAHVPANLGQLGESTGAGTCSSNLSQQTVSGSGLDQDVRQASLLSALQMGSSRALARARRAALATDGKQGALRVAAATRLTHVLPQTDWQQAIAKGVSGREVAKQRRLVRAIVGRQSPVVASTKPSGRMRAKHETQAAPAKVSLPPTRAGHSVTGTSTAVSHKVTGHEAGASKTVTGIEYLASEHVSAMNGPRSTPRPSMVMNSGILRDQQVNRTELGRQGMVTGLESGSTHSVTGTEYLSQHHIVKTPQVAQTGNPRKVSVMSSKGIQTASSLEMVPSLKVTGNESGAGRQLTGSQYFNAVDFGQPSATEAPSKVALIHTLAGSLVTGTELGRSQKVTGDNRGGCRAVTGTEFISSQQLQTVCQDVEFVSSIQKVGHDQTWNDQTVSGVGLGRSKLVTGNEHGACSPITGSAYLGRQYFQDFCEPSQTNAQHALGRREGSISASVVTGDRPGAGGSAMTGDQRGACGPVSGTPYVGADNMPPQCGTSARFVVPVRAEKASKSGVTAHDFSIRPPARQARERSSDYVTGSTFSSQRITGAANKGSGLITGTPEFRHREDDTTLIQTAKFSSGASKLTGEGSESGVPISGSAWKTSDRVTGTEGTSSTVRNPSKRGDVRETMGMSVKNSHHLERPEQPISRVTGSSGNTSKGAAVTLSGGARG